MTSQNLVVSVDNRNAFAPNVDISEDIVESNCDKKMKTKATKKRKYQVTQDQVENEQNEPESEQVPQPSKVDKKKKNVERTKDNGFRAKSRNASKRPIVSKKQIESEKTGKGKANKAKTTSKQNQIAKESTEQTDFIDEEVVPVAKRSKRAAPAISTPAEKPLTKKHQRNAIVASTAKANGTPNKKRKR